MIDIDKYKKILEADKEKVEGELREIADPSSESVGGWQAKGIPNDGEDADRNEVADRLEELGDREAIEATLEKRLENINDALKRVAEGTYGKCEFGGVAHDIEEARLDANPAAKTCIEHLDEDLV